MNENSLNMIHDNKSEEAKQAIYSSSYQMNRELFYDFSLMSYHTMKKLYLFFLCFFTFEIVVNILVENYDVFAIPLFSSVIFCTLYFATKNAARVNYERNVISLGKYAALKEEFYEDKIVSSVDELKREYFYHQVTGFFETKHFLLLHLQHRLYIAICKNTLDARVDEVKSFLIDKCSNVKKKKFINCSSNEKWSRVFMIAMIIVSVIGAVVAVVLAFRNPFL